jgi:hypothetical protein
MVLLYYFEFSFLFAIVCIFSLFNMIKHLFFKTTNYNRIQMFSILLAIACILSLFNITKHIFLILLAHRVAASFYF